MLAEQLKNEIFVLDGGLSTELERKGFSFQNDPLWSARLLHESPESITEVHRNYLESGADILATASYQASIPGFQRCLGLTVKASENLIKLSVELAKKAKKDFGYVSKGGKEILIAGSVGSYGAALADGSEYSGNYSANLSHEDFINWHRPRIQSLIDAGADLLAIETIPCCKEAEALMMLLKDFPETKAWLSFSCQSMHSISNGDNIGISSQKCAELSSPNQLVAIGVNCCSPDFTITLLEDIQNVLPNYPLIVYPNSGELWDTNSGWSGEKAKPNSMYVENWIALDAKIIGGCCRTGHEDIADIYKILQARKDAVRI